MNYWTKAEELKKKALAHTQEMHRMYSRDIDTSIRGTRKYSAYEYDAEENGDLLLLDNYPRDLLKGEAKIIFTKQTTVDALLDIPAAHPVCVLNFASYKEPGGMFMRGSYAQEESLCHASYLYNVLSSFGSYYQWNNEHKNRGLYKNRALYTPNIMFFNKEGNPVRRADVLTCAAPNRSLIKYGRFTEEQNEEALGTRIAFIADLLSTIRLNTEVYPRKIILGAFGCGVFKQDPETVAKYFKKSMKWLAWANEIIFAIPDNKIEIFKKVFISD